MVLHEKGVPYEFKSVNLAKQEHKSPEYVEKQPFGVVPYIVRLIFGVITIQMILFYDFKTT